MQLIDQIISSVSIVLDQAQMYLLIERREQLGKAQMIIRAMHASYQSNLISDDEDECKATSNKES